MLGTGVALAASPVAYVYLTGPGGIYAYEASSAGNVTAITGSPFTQTSGQAVGTNGTHFITQDPYFVYSYDVASDGVIGKEVSKIDAASNNGGCGVITQAELDHTGQYVYVALGSCGGWLQKYAIAKATGELTFVSEATLQPTAPGWWNTLPTFTGNDVNDVAAVGVQYTPTLGSDPCAPYFSGVSVWVDPTTPPGYFYYSPTGPMSDDPTNHLAVATAPVSQCGVYGPTQLATYTVPSPAQHGGSVGLLSTNTWDNMPTVLGYINTMKISSAGNLLAVAWGTGVQFYHFNGAKAITPFTGMIGTSGFIAALGWDSADHLYALNGESGRVHVYKATTTEVKEVSGSPYDIGWPTGVGVQGALIVRIIP
jgi:WD40 repeat protein